MSIRSTVRRTAVAVAGSACLLGGALAMSVAPAGAAVAGCENPGASTAPDGATLITNPVRARGGIEIGCVTTRHDGETTELVSVIADDGWSYRVKSGRTASSRVVVEFRNGKSSVTYKIEPGKLDVR